MKRLRYIIYFSLLALICFLFFLYIRPFGEAVYSHNFSNKPYNIFGGKGFFHNFGPEERVLGYNKIIADPAYFYLNTPRRFSSADIMVEYKISPELLSNDKYVDLKMGVLVDRENWRYSLKPLYNSFLNSIPDNWALESYNNIFFAQKERKFNNYNEFLESDSLSKSYFYNYSPPYDYVLPEKEPVNEEVLNIKNIRGSYSFYVYLQDGFLDLDFLFKKMEDYQDLSIYIRYGGEIIDRVSFFSDDFDNNNTLSFKLKNTSLPEGVYRVEILSNNNLLTKKLSSSSAKLSFLNRVWINQSEGEIKLFSNSNEIRIKALASACLGEIKINEEYFDINKIYEQYIFDLSGVELGVIEYSSCGLLIEGDGLFSFSEKSFFNPLLERVDRYSHWNNVDYVLAEYEKPLKKEESTFISFLNIDLTQAEKNKDGYHFIVSAPALSGDNSFSRYIEIKSIKIKLQGETLFNKIKRFLNDF
jgi:hypothetical protein